MDLHPEAYGHWDVADIDKLLKERDALALENLGLQERLGTTAVQLALSENKVEKLAAHNDGYALLTRPAPSLAIDDKCLMCGGQHNGLPCPKTAPMCEGGAGGGGG